MKTSNSGRILMTPGVTAAPFSEAMPAHPQNGDEVIAVNFGSSTYTLTGSISGGSLVLDAGESAILAFAATWYPTWNSGSGGITYPITAEKGGTGADLSGLDAGQLIAFDGASAFGGVTDGVGVLTSDGAGNLSWETPASGGVTLQASSPGTPDTGGLNVSLDGIFGGNIVASGTGVAAHVAIGSGVSVDATINLTAIPPGVVGNVYTVEIVSGAPTHDVALGVVEAGTVTTITLGTDGAGVLDPAKNTATLVLAALSGSTLFTGALAGTGADSLEAESQLFFGGAEAITASAGKVSALGGIFGFDALGVASNDIGAVYVGTFAAGSLSGVTTNKIAEEVGVNSSSFYVALDAFTPQAWVAIKEDGTGIGSTRQLWLGWEDENIGPHASFNTDPDFPGDAFFNIKLTVAAAQELIFDKDKFAPNSANLDLGANGLGLTGLPWATIWGGTGHAAIAAIGSGTDGTVNLVADAAGIAGNGFTVTVATGVGLNQPLTAAFTLQALLVTLATDGSGDPDDTANTATLVAGAINGEAGGVTATASGTGDDPLTGAEGPTTFAGGAESLTLAGGIAFGGTTTLLGFGGQSYLGTGYPATDFPIPGMLNVQTTELYGPLAAFFKNSDANAHDLVSLGFSNIDPAGPITNTAYFQYQSDGNGFGDSWFGFAFGGPATNNSNLHKFWSDGTVTLDGLGTAARASIGGGGAGEVNLIADAVGNAGNTFTVQVVIAGGANASMTAAFTLQALLVTLGTDVDSLPDPAKNTATLIAGAINTAAGGVTATAVGTGDDPLTGTEGPISFAGGAESVTSAGGFIFAGANIYLPNLPGTDPGIPGALYQTAGAVMVSL